MQPILFFGLLLQGKTWSPPKKKGEKKLTLSCTLFQASQNPYQQSNIISAKWILIGCYRLLQFSHAFSTVCKFLLRWPNRHIWPLVEDMTKAALTGADCTAMKPIIRKSINERGKSSFDFNFKTVWFRIVFPSGKIHNSFCKVQFALDGEVIRKIAKCIGFNVTSFDRNLERILVGYCN